MFFFLNYRWEYSAKPTSQLEGLVKKTRIQATNIKAEYQPVIDKITHVVETGVAHTNRTCHNEIFQEIFS